MDYSFIENCFESINKLLSKFLEEFANEFLKEFLIRVCWLVSSLVEWLFVSFLKQVRWIAI